ncbi:MAG: ParB-like protein [Azonexus sp.]|jgi:hypothetical protein
MKMASVALLGALLAAGGVAAAPDYAGCHPRLAVGTVCEADLAQLHPTQFGVGLLQVAREKRELARQRPSSLQKTVLKKRIAVVIGPDGRFWLVDRHHLSRALWEIGERKAPVHIVGRVEKPDGFWQVMSRAHWAWLFDERGNPRDPADLPGHIKDLPDFGYRSLAGFAEDEHLFNKSAQVFFIEFTWARYFGEQLGWAEITTETLHQRLDDARRVACLPAASSLPGYPGAACRK